MNIPQIDLPRVVIIGAGFSGLKVAKLINTHRYQVVIIDKRNYHTFQPLLYQVASTGLEPDSIAYPVRKILKSQKNTFFRLCNVENIDKDKNILNTDIGDLSYDILVIATGAGNNFFGNDVIEKNSLPMKSLIDALNLRSKILGNFEEALNTKDLNRRESLMNFVIVGGGPTGVELAGALAELRNKVLAKDYPDLDLRQMKINLIESAPRVLANMAEKSSEVAYKSLKELDVLIWTNTFVKNYENNVVSTQTDLTFNADTLIWAAGVKGNMLKGISNEDQGKGNRIIVDEFCKLKSSDNIYVLGDVALIESDLYPNGLPMLGSVAMQQGVYLANLLNQKAKGKKSKPFVYKHKGIMATIGRNAAVVEMGNLKIQGALAWAIWMFVHLMLLVGFRNRVVVFINWLWKYVNFNNSLRLIIRPYKTLI